MHAQCVCMLSLCLQSACECSACAYKVQVYAHYAWTKCVSKNVSARYSLYNSPRVTFRWAGLQRRPGPGDTGGRGKACRPACPGRSGSCVVCRARTPPLPLHRADPARPVGRAPLVDPARLVDPTCPAGTGSTPPTATGIWCTEVVKVTLVSVIALKHYVKALML